MRSRKARGFRSRRVNQVLSVFISVVMVLSTSNLEYVAKAYAADASAGGDTSAPIAATTTAATSDENNGDTVTTGETSTSSTGDAASTAPAADTSNDTVEAPAATAAPVASGVSDVTPAPDTSTTETPATTSPAAVHQAVSGDLPLKLSFSLDGVSVDPVSVTLQLQSRTATWDAATSTWGDYGEWTNVSGDAARVDLSADDLAAVKDASSQYTFKNLSLQTVTSEGAYDGRTQYRAIEAKVDGAELVFGSTAEDGTMTYTATMTKDATDTTPASTVDYVVTLAKDAALEATTTDEATDVAKLANDKPEKIDAAGTTALQESAAAAPMMMLSPMATTHTVTFMANGSKVEGLTETVADGEVATKPTDDQIQQNRLYFSVGALLFNNGVDNPGVWLTADGSVYDFSTPVTSDITLYAKYAQIGTYVVYNTSLNSTTGDNVTYTLSKEARVSVAGGSYVTYAANTDISVPANGKMDILFSSTSDDLTVTFVNSTDCVAIGATTATFPVEKNEVTFTSEFALDNVNLNKQWFDGAAATKPALNLSLQYSTDGTTWTTVADANKATVGLQTVPTVPAANETLSNPSVSVYSFSKSLFGYTTTDGTAVTYRLAENSVPSGYVSSYSADDATVLVNTLKNPFSATKKWADGDNAFATRLDIDAWIAAVNAQGGAKRSSLYTEDANITLTTDSTRSSTEGYVVVTDNGDGTWTISMPNTLGFDSQDAPYTYSIAEGSSITPKDGNSATTGTTYVPTYHNEGNYASITNALYTGGTLTNTLSDTSTFTAAKAWKDDNAASTIESRPAAALTLYRYPDKTGESYQTASPVAGVTLEMVANPTGSASTFTVQPKAGSASLPEYNEDGYKYVYFAKETLTGGANTYKQVFVNNGTVTGNDKFLFNGGELDNTITGTVDLTGTKTWVAAARQDVDAQVEMKVYQLDQDDISKSGFVATQTLTGFGTETPSKTVTFTDLPKYNANGHQYIYTVMEGAVNTEVGSGFESTETKIVDGKGYLITTDGYRYRQDQTLGSSDTTINNVLVGNAQVVIDKTFTNGLLASPTALTYTIYQNGTAIGTKTVSYTGNVDGTAFTPDPITITSYEEMDNGSYTGSGLLPRYDASGAQYKYTVAETSITPDNTYGTTTNNAMSEGTYPATDPNYADEKYSLATATISNYKPGEGMSITVHKNWIDAGDSMSRQPVNVELQYTADGTTWSTVAAGTIATSTDYVYIGVPKTVPAGSAGTDTYQDLYKAWITAGKPAAAAGAFRVVETSLGSTGQYAVVADGDANTTTNPEHESGWSFVSTDDQNYDVSPTGNVSEGGYDYTITNKRVGVEKIVVNKTWVDGNNAKDSRPASITFTVTASESVFDGGTTASKDFTMTPDVNGTWSLDTGWLQKYDYSTGAFITYSIAEKSLNYAEGKTSYADQYTRIWSHSGDGLGYVVGSHHTGDTDTYALANSLSGTVIPLMNKYWKDLGDAATIAKRPDIYPVLFRDYVTQDAEGNDVHHYEKMTYQDRDWNTEVKNDNWWQCTFVAQPRYTDDGYEYTYYVGEKFSSAILNDYVCSGAYADMPGEDGSYSEFTDVAETTQKAKVTITVDGTTYAVAQLDNVTGHAGTIVNKPVAQRAVSGTKTWTNLPTGFKKQYLPDVTFSMRRYLGNGTQTQADAVQVTGVSTTLKTGSTTFAFDGTYDRYNVDGIPYVYIVKETSPNNMGLAYTITNTTGTGLSVKNEFKNTQSYGITFTKNWSGVPTGATSGPSATLTLVRYLTDGTGAIITGSRNSVFADNATTYGNVNQVTLAYAGSTTQTVNWTNLAYYGPNGNPYVYYVEESGVTAGYTVYDAAGTNKVTATTADGKTVYAVLVSGSYDTATNSGSGTAGLTNKYGEVLGNVRVAKSWSGNYDSYNVSYKPSVTLKLWRFTYSTPPNPVQAGEVTLYGTETPTAWQKDVTGLEIYAPNGDKYYYIATEGADSALVLDDYTGQKPRDGAISSSIAPTGFTVTGASYEVQANAGSPAAVGVTNAVDSTSLNVTKAWVFGTGTNFTPSNDQLMFGAKISGVPTSIVYRFQYSTDNGATWSVLNDKSGNPIVQTISQNADGSFGTASLSGLPTYTMMNGTATATMYRAFEYSLMYKDGTTQTRAAAPTGATDSGYIGDVATTGSGTTAAGATTAGTTATTNTVPVRKITITKTWSDECNRDGVRPTSVSFDITRTGVETASDTQTETVTLTAANKTDDNTWTASYYVPVYWNVDTSAQSTYTIAETVPTGYTAYEGTSANPTTEGSSVSVAGGTADASAYFKNSFTHTKFALTPEKVWSFEGTNYTGATDLPEWLRAYLPSDITFTLEAETVDASGNVATAWTSDFTKFGNDFQDIPNTLNATVNGTTGKITIAAPGYWMNLPRFASDTDVSNLLTYHYRMTETLAAVGQVYAKTYSTSDLNASTVTADSTDNAITATNTFARATLAITKTWSDQKNACNTRPNAIKYTVQYSTDGNTWTTVPDAWANEKTTDGVVTVTPTNKNADGSYNATIDSLPKYATDGTTVYKYRAVETALVYGSTDVVPGASETDAKPYYVTATTSASGSTYTTAFTNTLVYTSFTVTKAWADSTPTIADQVTSVRYYLQQSSDGTNWTYVLAKDGTTKDYWTLDAASSWTKTMNYLPKYDSNGNAYSYRAVENLIVVDGKTVNATNAKGTTPTSGTVGGFTDETSADGTTITNTTVTTTVYASKTWDDGANAQGTRPTSVTFHLLQNGTDLGTTYQKTVTGKVYEPTWGPAIWTGLPKMNAAGTEYTYTVTEDTVAGYTSAVTNTGSGDFPFVFTVTNTPIPVTISKVASDGNKLPGATFTLKGTFTNGAGEETKTWTSAANSVWDLTGLLVQGNVYTLTETVPPTGYTLPASTTTYLKVDDSGKLYTGTTAASQTTAVTDNALAISDAPTKVTITKTDASGNNLSGATLRIVGTFADETDQTKTTADNTTITANTNPFSLTGRLIAGNTYAIAEMAAPAGYLTMQSSFTVTMGTDGHLTAGTLPAGVNVTIDYDATNGATVTVADQPTAFTVNKYASTDTGHVKPIAGAVFTVTPAAGKTFADTTTAAKTITTTADGTAGLSATLIADTSYTIQETTPAPGYELPADNPARIIHITNAGQLQESADNGATWTDITDNKLAFSDVATKATLVKQNAADSTQIGGSTYTLTGTFADGSTSQTLAPTASTAATLSAEMIADNATTYTLKETTPAPGYKTSPLTDSCTGAVLTADGAMTLKMDMVGQLYYKTGETTWQAVDSNALVMKDKQNALTITKVTSPVTTGPTATFTITGIFADSNGRSVTETIVDGATSGTMTGNLIAGQSYAISETTPPVGYCAVSDFSITMNADGTITTTLPSGVALSADTNGNSVLTVTDPQTKVTLTKTDGASPANNLSGAVFTITRADDGAFVDNNTTMTWNTTDNNAFDSTNFVAGQTYKFSETTIPNGYEKVADFSVTMSLAGKLQGSGTVPSGVTIADTSVTVVNTQNSVTIAKHNETGQGLAGAHFTITGMFIDAASMEWGSTATADQITGKMIAGKTYLFHEHDVPAGYTSVADFSVTMGADGKLSAAKNTTLPDGVAISDDGLTLTVTDAPNSFTLTKMGTDGAALAGATFTLTDASGDNLADGTASYAFDTTADASTITGKLVACTDTTTHTYKLEETTPAHGYTAVAPVYLRVDKAGSLSSSTAVDGTFAAVTGNALTLTDAKTAVSISKVDATDTATLLAGASFSLSGTFVTSKSPVTWTSAADAARTITGELIAGNEYKLTETAPAPGHVLSPWTLTYENASLDGGALVIKVDDSGQLLYKSTAADGWTVIAGNAIAMKDSENVFSLAKQNASEASLAATFTVTPAANSTFADNSTDSKTIAYNPATAGSGTLSGSLVSGDTYAVKETVVPAGYTVIPDFSFTVAADGTLAFSSDHTGVALSDTTFTVTDTQNKVTLAKHDQNGDGLAGAHFTITGTFAGGETLVGWESESAPETLEGEMVAGQTYSFHETTAAPGYLTVPDFSVTMGADGILTAGALPDGTAGTGSVAVTYDAATATNSITITDAPTVITLHKVGERDRELTGATFTVTPETGKTFADGTTDAKTILSGTSSEEWTGQLVTGVTYTFAETASPDLYVTMQPFTVSVASDGTVSVGGTGASSVTIKGTDITAKNSPMTAQFTLRKIDATDGSAITSRATIFEVKKVGSTWTGLAPTDANGDLTLTNLSKGTWTVTEKTADPNYYNNGFSCTFTVTDACQDKTLTIDTNGDTNNATLFQLRITADGGHVTAGGLQNERQTGTVNVEKLGADSKALEGATFEVHKKSDGTLVGTADTTDASGMVSFSGLAWDTYYLVETAVPAGYQVDSTHREFSIGYGNLTKNFADSSAITNTKNSFTLTKNAAGATFTVTGELADGTSSAMLTGATSYTETGLLTGGKTYVVTETVPPAGYKVVPVFHVTMSTDGTLSSSDLPSGVSLTSNTISVIDSQNSITITKTDNAKPANNLAGATFELSGVDGATFVHATGPITWTTDVTSNSYSISGELIAGKVYKLAETSPAPGYTVASDTYLKVDVWGALWKSESADGTYIKVDDNELTVADEQNKALFGKGDAGSGNMKLVAGATFSLKGAFADKTTEKTFTSLGAYPESETGIPESNGAFIGQLITGNQYALAETAPAPGYVISSWASSFADTEPAPALDADGALIVRMTNDGILEYKTGTDAWSEFVSDNFVMMKDAQTSISVTKVGIGGAALAGATFELSGVDGATFAHATSPITWTSDTAAHVITGELVAGSVYKLAETSPGPGYTLAADTYLKVDAQGTLWSSSSATGAYTQLANPEIAVTDARNTFTLEKLNERGVSLSGATFTVTPEAGKAFATADANGSYTEPRTILSGASSQTWTGQLVSGVNYTFVETTSPAVYVTMAPFTVSVSDDGTVTATGDGVSVDGTTVTAKNKLMTAAFALHKVDATDGSAITSRATIFEVKKVGSTWTGLAPTDANGDLTLTNLSKGTWTVTEKTADPNYYNNGFSCTFTVTDACQDKTLTIDTNNATNNAELFGLDITEDSDHVTANGLANARVRGSVNIKKLGVGTDAEGLDGVRFALYKASGEFVYAALTSDGGELSIVNLPWGDYYLVETAVPAGYQVDSTHHDFTIGYGALTANFTGDLAITNTKNSFTLTKNAAGATFTVTGELADGTSSAMLTGATSYTETGLLVGGNTYTVTETVPPEGYMVVPVFHVTMGTDGTLSSSDLPAGTSLENNVITVADPQNMVSLQKVDASGELLEGSAFNITGIFAGQTSESTVPLLSNGSRGGMVGELIAGNTYTIHEKTLPLGYAQVPDFQITVANDGTISFVGSHAGVTLKDTVLTATDEQTTASFSKVDADGTTVLEGAKFSLTGYFASDVMESSSKTWTSAASAEAIVGEMIANYKYTLVETSPAPGHVISPWTDTYKDAALNSNPTSPKYNDGLNLMMDSAGQLWYASNDPEALAAWVKVDDNAIAMKDAETNISVKKVDEVGNALPGATFTLSGAFADGSETPGSITWTSGSDAKAFTGQLIVGNVYKLHEDTPAEGYTVAPDVYLKLDDSGALLTCATADGTFEANTSNDLAIADVQTSISISKTNTDGTAKLDGAHLTLSGFFADGSGVESTIQWTSSATGAKDFTGELIVGNVYKLVENTPPSGYATVSAVYLKVDASGALWTCYTSDGTFTTAPNDFVLKDVKTSFELKKVDDGSEPLTGATFMIKGTFADGSTELPLISGAAVANLTGKLVAGNTYTVIETLPPAGYKAIDPFVITVSADGTKLQVSSASGSTEPPAGVSVSADGASVTVMDDPVAVTFMKTDRTTGDQLINHRDCIFRVKPVSDGTLADGETTQVEGYDDQITSQLRGQFIVTELTRDAQGNYQITGTPHVYSIQEIQEPGGYQIEPDAVQFIVDQYGDVHVLNGEGTIVTSADGTSDLSFSDPTIKVSFAKTTTSGTSLAGASFELDGTFVASDGTNTTTPIIWTSTTSLQTVDAMLIAGQTYILTEKSAPNGYDAIPSSVSFTVDSLGNVKLMSDAGGAATLSGSASDTAGMVISIADPATPATAVTPVSKIPSTSDAMPTWPLPAAIIGGALAVYGARRRRRDADGGGGRSDSVVH